MKSVGMSAGRRWVVWSLVVALVLLVAACGSGSGSGTTSGSSSASNSGSQSSASAPAASNAGSSANEPSKPEDPYPEKNIRLIVASSAGGGLDTATRQIQPFLEKYLGTKLMIENHAGGNYAVATTLVVEGPDDGYMILMSATPHFHFSFLTQEVNYKFEDLTPVGSLLIDPGLIRVREDAPWKDLRELIEYAKTQPPGTLSASVSHRTSNNFLALKQLEAATGVQFNIVPFGGGNEARLALLRGEVQLTHAGVFNSLSAAEGTRVIGVQHSSNDWPDITDNAKTFNEQLDTPVPDSFSTYGLFVATKMKEAYPERYQKLVDAFAQAMNDPEYRALLAKTNEEAKAVYMNPEEYHKANVEMLEDLLKYLDYFKE